MWVTRLDRTRDFVNDAYMEFLGTDDREIARTYDWRTGIHPDDVDRIVAESIAGEAMLKPFTLEGRFRRGDGTYRWLKSTSSPRFGPDGDHIGFIGVASDITLAKEAELELRRSVEERTRELAVSEARFRAVFDTVLEVLVLMEPDGTIVEMNRKDAPWRAKHRREGVGKKIWEAPTSRHVPAAYSPDEKSGEAGGGREIIRAGSANGARGHSDRLSRRFGAARARQGRQAHLSALRGARHHRPQGRAGTASPKPEDGGARPAHRRNCARLQQPVDCGGRRPRHHCQARRRREAEALCRECAGGCRARGAADRAIARVQPGPAPRGTTNSRRSADPEHAAAPAQCPGAGNHQRIRPRRGDDAGDG